jgi:two-component system CheB/CheR fusion protein
MNSPFDGEERDRIRDHLMGLGKRSIRKSYYPELQERGAELERFRVLLEHVPDAIFFVDMATMSIVDANGAATDMTGYDWRELEQLRLDDVLQESGDRLFHGVQKYRGEGELQGTWCTHLASRSGSAVPVEVTLKLHVYRGQEYAVLVARDISERLRYEEDLVRARKEAEQASRSKGEFLATMSHEIRTPLNGILGMAELLLQSETRQREGRLLALLKKSGRNLQRILNDILDFSKMEAGRLELVEEEFDLSELAMGVVDFLAARVGTENRVKMSCSVAPGLQGRWMGDGGRIQQVLMNIVGNAVKFTRKGSIDVMVQEVNGDAGDHLFREVLFSVRDTGRGIPSHKLETVFESFSQADGSMSRVHQGTGLGLAICRQLVRLMGGTIWVTSREGEGASFFFSLPLRRVQRGDEDVIPSGMGQFREPHMNVLLVEDNKVNRIYAQHLLRQRGHSVVCAASGREVLDILARKRPDCILMDIQMPEMDGLETTRRIRESVSRDIPIIALTAHAMQGDRERFLAAGMTDYLSKPLEAGALWDALGRVHSEAKQGREGSSVRLEPGQIDSGH